MGHLTRPPAPIVIDSDDEEEECTNSTSEREASRGQRTIAAGGRGQKEEENPAAKRPRLDAASVRDCVRRLPGSWKCSACTSIDSETTSLAYGMCTVERAERIKRDDADTQMKKTSKKRRRIMQRPILQVVSARAVIFVVGGLSYLSSSFFSVLSLLHMCVGCHPNHDHRVQITEWVCSFGILRTNCCTFSLASAPSPLSRSR
jgi:hypothetical protein